MKIIATDLDGTLFYPKDRKNIICKKNLFFVQQFIDQGGKFAVVTGRSFSFCKKVEKVIGRNIDIIAYNGALIYSNGKIISTNIIENDIAKDIIDALIRDYKPACITLMCDDGMYYIAKNGSILVRVIYKLYYKIQKQYAEKSYFRKDEYYDALKSKRIFKILVVFGINKKATLKAEEVSNVLNNSYSNISSTWTNYSMEITKIGIFKGDSLEQYCDLNKFDKNDVYVVGDSGNDISMFKKFYDKSFVMSKGTESVKKFAKYEIEKFEDLSRYIYEK